MSNQNEQDNRQMTMSGYEESGTSKCTGYEVCKAVLICLENTLKFQQQLHI